MANRIEIKGIRGHGWHGVLPEERRAGQDFIVDVALDVHTLKAAQTDNLTDTVDYGMVARLVYAHIVGPPFNLIETLAHHIADELLTLDHVEAVTVSVHKPHAPIPVPFSDAIVSVHRSR